MNPYALKLLYRYWHQNQYFYSQYIGYSNLKCYSLVPIDPTLLGRAFLQPEGCFCLALILMYLYTYTIRSKKLEYLKT